MPLSDVDWKGNSPKTASTLIAALSHTRKHFPMNYSSAKTHGRFAHWKLLLSVRRGPKPDDCVINHWASTETVLMGFDFSYEIRHMGDFRACSDTIVARQWNAHFGDSRALGCRRKLISSIRLRKLWGRGRFKVAIEIEATALMATARH